MNYSRGSVLAGEDISLRAVFIDSQNNLITPDAVPSLYIYDESIDTDTIEAEIEDATFASAIAGPLTPTELSTGYYGYTYTVPTTYEAGTWHDVWVAEVNGIENSDILSFTVEEEIEIDPQSISSNTMIIIELADSILDEDGTAALEETKLYYTTTYDPLYASPDLVRAELGPWIDYIPDDTLALMLHWSSKEAKFIQGEVQKTKGNIKLARAKFVVFDAAMRAINQPGAGQKAGYQSNSRKRLGDLDITIGDVNVTIPESTISWIREQRQLWWKVVNSGGNLVPGQGFAPSTVLKGELDVDRRVQGRLWETDVPFTVPTVNRKRLRGTRRMGRFTYEFQSGS